MGRVSLSMTIKGFKYISRNVKGLKRGQYTNFAILQMAHRLEKGLCIRNPRKGWGYDKAEKLVDLIVQEKQHDRPDEFAISIGQAVLSAYVNAKKSDVKESGLVEKLEKKIAENGISLFIDETRGGAVLIRKEDMINDFDENLFFSRHSVRDFADTDVDPAILEHAINMALCSPSACNRQATQIYVINGDDRVKAGSSNEYHANKYLIFTSNINAFTVSELNDWIVSSSIFAGYLSLALHACGVGSCFFRKDIICESTYNNNIRKMCNIPDDEEIVLEMAIGNYKNEFLVPVSCRRNARDIIHYLK